MPDFTCDVIVNSAFAPCSALQMFTVYERNLMHYITNSFIDTFFWHLMLWCHEILAKGIIKHQTKHNQNCLSRLISEILKCFRYIWRFKLVLERIILTIAVPWRVLFQLLWRKIFETVWVRYHFELSILQ